MFCAKCGQRLADTVKFCPACGAPTVNANKPAEPVITPVAEPVPEVEPVPAPAPAAEPVAAEQDIVFTTESEPTVGPEPVQETTNTFVYDQDPADKDDDVIYDAYQDNRRQDQPVRYEKYKNPNGKAVASIVLGIVAIVLCWVPLVPVIVSIIGLIMSIVAAKKKTGSSMYVAGLTLSLVALVISILITAAWVVMFLWIGGFINIPALNMAGYYVNSAVSNAAYELGYILR